MDDENLEDGRKAYGDILVDTENNIWIEADVKLLSDLADMKEEEFNEYVQLLGKNL